jgi:hypothetical protein
MVLRNKFLIDISSGREMSGTCRRCPIAADAAGCKRLLPVAGHGQKEE